MSKVDLQRLLLGYHFSLLSAEEREDARRHCYNESMFLVKTPSKAVRVLPELPDKVSIYIHEQLTDESDTKTFITMSGEDYRSFLTEVCGGPEKD